MKTINSADALVSEYMAQLDDSLSSLPVQRREEILTEVAHHIEEGRALLDVDDVQSVSALLDRIGDPSTIAAEAGAAPPVATKRPLLLVLCLVALGLGIVAVLFAALAFNHGSGSPSTSTARTPAISVPLVVGMSATGATEELHNAGLRAEISSSYSNIAPLGMVLSQKPGPTSKVAKGSTVTLTKSLGPRVIPPPGT